MNLDTMKSSDVKKVLKQAGFDTKLISVTKGYSSFNVTLNSYSLPIAEIKNLLEKYSTLRNISNDMDSIYVGTGVRVEYNFWANLPLELEEQVKKAKSQFADPNPQGLHVAQVMIKNNPQLEKHFGSAYQLTGVLRRCEVSV